MNRARDAGVILFCKTNVPLKLIEWQRFNEIYFTTHNAQDKSWTRGCDFTALVFSEAVESELGRFTRHLYAFESGTILCPGRTMFKIVRSISTDVRPAASYISTGDPWSMKTSGSVMVRILIPLSNWPDAAR